MEYHAASACPPQHALTKLDLEICAALKREAEDIQELIMRLRAKLMSPPANRPSRLPRAKREHGSLEPMMETLLELEEMYGGKISAFFHHVRQVELAIAAVWKTDARRVLRMRYVLGMTWADIGEKMRLDERYCRRLLRRGLDIMGIE